MDAGNNPPTAPGSPPPDAVRIESLRTDYRYLMRKASRETFDKDDAIELIHVCMELGHAGYTLTADESDWQPATGKLPREQEA